MAHLEEGWFESPEGGPASQRRLPSVPRPFEEEEAGEVGEARFELAGGGALLGNGLDEEDEPDLDSWLEARRAGRAAARGDEAPLPPPAEAAPPPLPEPVEAAPPAPPAAEPAEAVGADWFSDVPVEEGAVDDAGWADEAPAPRDEDAWAAPASEAAEDPAWAGPASETDDEPAWADDPWTERGTEPEGPTPRGLSGAADTEEEADPDEAEDAVEDDGRVVRARPASYGAHALAWAVDGAVLAGAAGALLWLAGRVVGASAGLSAAVAGPSTLVAAVLVGAVMGVFYTAGFTLAGGQTLGGRLAGVTILDGSGFPPPPGRAFLRAVLAVPGILLIGVGLAWVVVDGHGQSLHDRIARTWAVEID